MAALTGDIYNMLQTRSNSKSAASSIGKVQFSSDSQNNAQQKPEIIKPSEIKKQQDNENDMTTSREVTDTATGERRNESASAIETALNSVRVWLGDDYQLSLIHI